MGYLVDLPLKYYTKLIETMKKLLAHIIKGMTVAVVQERLDLWVQ